MAFVTTHGDLVLGYSPDGAEVPPSLQGLTPDLLFRRAFFVDQEYLSFDWLRPIQEDKDLAKTGDAKQFVIHGEGALIVKNEAAHGEIADIFGLNAAA